ANTCFDQFGHMLRLRHPVVSTLKFGLQQPLIIAGINRQTLQEIGVAPVACPSEYCADSVVVSGLLQEVAQMTLEIFIRLGKGVWIRERGYRRTEFFFDYLFRMDDLIADPGTAQAVQLRVARGVRSELETLRVQLLHLRPSEALLPFKYR